MATDIKTISKKYMRTKSGITSHSFRKNTFAPTGRASRPEFVNEWNIYKGTSRSSQNIHCPP